MNLATFVFAAALAGDPQEKQMDLLRKLTRHSDPFAVAAKLVGRSFSTSSPPNGEWRRYDAESGFIDLGPFEAGEPKKIVVVSHFKSRADAAEYFDSVSNHLHSIPHPRLPFHEDAPFSYRGAMVLARRPVGLEVVFAPTGDGWRVAVTLVEGGPRVVLPIADAVTGGAK